MKRRTVARLLTAATLGLTGLVTAAGGAQAAGPGWYGSAPFTIDSSKCTGWARLASGSDGKGVYAKVCIVKVRDGVAQPVSVFSNTSRSNVVARATNTVTDENGVVLSADYTCNNKTLPAYGSLYCVGYQTGFLTSARNYGQPAIINAYGVAMFSPVIYYYV
jgi:hypothetical protein